MTLIPIIILVFGAFLIGFALGGVSNSRVHDQYKELLFMRYRELERMNEKVKESVIDKNKEVSEQLAQPKKSSIMKYKSPRELKKQKENEALQHQLKMIERGARNNMKGIILNDM